MLKPDSKWKGVGVWGVYNRVLRDPDVYLSSVGTKKLVEGELLRGLAWDG